MTQGQLHVFIGFGSALFAVLCVTLLPGLLVALVLGCAVSVIGIAVEKETRSRKKTGG